MEAVLQNDSWKILNPNIDRFISLLPVNRIPHFRSTVGPQNGVPPQGPLHLHSAGVTFQHLPDPIIIQRSLYELLQTDDSYRHNKDRRWAQTKNTASVDISEKELNCVHDGMHMSLYKYTV